MGDPDDLYSVRTSAVSASYRKCRRDILGWAFAALAICLFPEAEAATPFVTQCPDYHPSYPRYPLVYGEVLPFGSIRTVTDDGYFGRDNLEIGLDDFSDNADRDPYRKAKLACTYDNGQPRPYQKEYLMDIPGRLWRCETVFRTWGRLGMDHIWVWCLSLPD